MELAYQKLIAEHKLNVADLPEDARDGINELKAIQGMVAIREKKGKAPALPTVKKIKRLDKWVCMEIIDYVEDKDTNTAAPDVTAEEIKQDIKADDATVGAAAGVAAATTEPIKDNNTEPVPADPKGVAIDEEVKALIEAGIKQLTLPELKEKAPKAYSVIFNSYDEGGENGIETTYHRIIETEKEKFTISKI